MCNLRQKLCSSFPIKKNYIKRVKLSNLCSFKESFVLIKRCTDKPKPGNNNKYGIKFFFGYVLMSRYQHCSCSKISVKSQDILSYINRHG